MRIRRARPAEAPALARLEARLYTHDLIGLPDWMAILDDPRREIWVLPRPDDAPAGLLLLAKGRQNLRIEDLGVDPAHQGRGLGRRLLQHALRRARRLDKRRVTLEVRPENTSALRLYETTGFRRLGTRPHYYEDGATALRLGRELET